MQSHGHLPLPSSFLSSLHPSRGSPHFPREDSAGDLPTEEEVGAGPAADAAVTSEPATGGGQPEAAGTLCACWPWAPRLPPLNPFPASLSQTAIPQPAWPTRFPDFTTRAGADSRTVSSGRETPGCLASRPGTSQPPSLPSSQTQRGWDLPAGLLTHRGT